MAESQGQRLFFALWPEPEVAQRIWQATDKLVSKGVGRRLPAPQLHLTLVYLGQQDVQQLQCISDVASRVRAQSFTLTLDRSGHFPRPQVLWLGASQIPSVLTTLHADLVSQLAQHCGYKPEARAFLPHITISRKVRRAELPEHLLPLTWPVSRFVLASSETQPSGAVYSVIRTWQLDANQE